MNVFCVFVFLREYYYTVALYLEICVLSVRLMTSLKFKHLVRYCTLTPKSITICFI
jgi:hypothetical protein